MILKSELIIKEFFLDSEANILESIYLINQSNTPEVGDLGTFDDLIKLLRLSFANFYLSYDNKVIGFIVCFRESSDYWSQNYKFFSNNTEKFLYIDRIAVKKEFRRNNLASDLYKYVEKKVNYENLPLCCEVNIKPLNKASIKFHYKYGFKKIGTQNFVDHSVAYFKK